MYADHVTRARGRVEAVYRLDINSYMGDQTLQLVIEFLASV